MMAWRLTHRIHIQQPVETQDPVKGDMTTTWETVMVGNKLLDSYPAEVLTGAGSEQNNANSTQTLTTARINVRWFPYDRLEITKCRILWDGRVYNITSAETDRTARQEWRFICQDGLNNG